MLQNIKRLVVRQRNTMASIMAVLRMSQDSDQAILNYIAQLRAAARQCDFKLKCGCGKDNDFTESIILYKLVAGVSDMELQEELLTKADLTLATAEKLAVAKESAKFSQAAMTGEGISGLKSSYKRNKSDDKSDSKKGCSYCGGPKQHSDSKKECPAWAAKCPCGVPHHYQHLCRRKGVPPTTKQDSPKPETDKPKDPSKENINSTPQFHLEILISRGNPSPISRRSIHCSLSPQLTSSLTDSQENGSRGHQASPRWTSSHST